MDIDQCVAAMIFFTGVKNCWYISFIFLDNFAVDKFFFRRYYANLYVLNMLWTSIFSFRS